MGQQLTAGDICKRKVTVGYRQTTLVAAAQLMREDHVGSVVVVEEDDGSRRVCGLVTDRDIVMSVVATGLQPGPLCPEDIMSEQLVTVAEGDAMPVVMRAMRDHGVRRLPVVDAHDELLGIVTMDDVLKILVRELNMLVGTMETSIRHEHARRQ